MDEVQLDFVVRTKYRARICMWNDVSALATTSALFTASAYASSLEADPVPCCTSSTLTITRRFGSSLLRSAMNSGHAVGSSDVTITLLINGSNLVKLFTAARYSSSGGQSSSPPAEPDTLCPKHLSLRRMGTPNRFEFEGMNTPNEDIFYSKASFQNLNVDTHLRSFEGRYPKASSASISNRSPFGAMALVVDCMREMPPSAMFVSDPFPVQATPTTLSFHPRDEDIFAGMSRPSSSNGHIRLWPRPTTRLICGPSDLRLIICSLSVVRSSTLLFLDHACNPSPWAKVSHHLPISFRRCQVNPHQ